MVLALEDIADELVAKVKKGVDALSVGAPEVHLLLQPALAWVHTYAC